jgi:hypothetical protein
MVVNDMNLAGVSLVSLLSSASQRGGLTDWGIP